MKNLLAALGAAMVISACNQTPSTNNTGQYEMLFKKAYDLKDVRTAITAVQLILVQDSTHYLRDSLPVMYLRTQNFDACLTTTEAALKRRPADEELTKYKLLCYEQMGKGDEVLKLSRELYTKTGKVDYIYKTATVEIMMGDFDKAGKTIDDMMKKHNSPKDSVDVFIDEGMRPQRVPVSAAGFQMIGFMLVQEQQYQQALEAYKKALQIYPESIMARSAIQQLTQGMRRQ